MITKTENRSDVIVVDLEGVLEVSLQQTLKDKLLQIAREQNDMVLNFSQVTFIDSSCLGALVSLAKTLREQKGDIKLVRLTDDVQSIFQITRLDRIFEIFESVDSAVESFYTK